MRRPLADQDQDLATTTVESAVPPWITAMRQAAQRVLKQEDVEAIINAQVEAAKKGNQQAIKFVFEQVLGGAAMKGATFVQNNYSGGADPRSPTDARPGTAKKKMTMAARAAAGLPLTDPADGPKDDDR